MYLLSSSLKSPADMDVVTTAIDDRTWGIWYWRTGLSQSLGAFSMVIMSYYSFYEVGYIQGILYILFSALNERTCQSRMPNRLFRHSLLLHMLQTLFTAVMYPTCY